MYNLETLCIASIKHFDSIIFMTDKNTKQQITALDVIYNRLEMPKKVFFNNLLCSFTPEYILEWENTDYDPKLTMDHHCNVFENITLPVKLFEILYTQEKGNIMKYFNIFLLFSYFSLWSYIFFYSF